MRLSARIASNWRDPEAREASLSYFQRVCSSNACEMAIERMSSFLTATPYVRNCDILSAMYDSTAAETYTGTAIQMAKTNAYLMNLLR